MKQLQANIIHAATNLHVSVPVVLGAILYTLPIWFPQYADKLNATATVLTAYGIIGAANTPPTKQTPIQQ